MWRSAYLLPILLLLLLAVPAWSDEAESQSEAIDPAEVAKLLLSDDEQERAQGAALLRARIERGGDVQTWLLAMARAQAEWADAEERLVGRWIQDVLRGTPETAERARRLLAAMGRAATRRLLLALKNVQALLPQQAVAGEAKPSTGKTRQTEPTGQPEGVVHGPVPDVPPPPGDPPTPEAPAASVAAAPVARVRATVLEVPRDEILDDLVDARSDYGVGKDRLLVLRGDEALVLREGAGAILARAAALPEVRTRPASQGLVAPGRRFEIVQGDELRYRSRARKTKGAWAVETGTVDRGLRVSLLLEPDERGDHLVLEARYVTVHDPLPTEQVQPAGDVEPLELDRPEWESASMTLKMTLKTTLRARVARTGGDLVALFPGLVPGKVVVVGLTLLPLGTEAALRQVEK